MDFGLYGHQGEFLTSEARHTGLVCGLGAGKSFAGCVKTVYMMVTHRCNVGYYLPQIRLLKDVGYKTFIEVLEKMGIPYHINRTVHDIVTEFGKIMLRAMDEPSKIIGYEVGYSCIDEADNLPTQHMKDLFVAIVGRTRTPIGVENKVDVVSSPEGIKFCHHYFVEKENPKHKRLIQASTDANKSLSRTYVEGMELNYSKAQIKAYRYGQFIPLTAGLVYHYFKRHKNDTLREIKRSDVLKIGIDFNIANMSAVVCVYENRQLHAVDEFVKVLDTLTLIKKIREKYPNHSIEVYPDASGINRSTSSNLTDIELLEKEFRVIAGTKNPGVKDRVGHLNRSLFRQDILVNCNICTTLVRGLESQVYNKKGEPDKTSDLDHILDAFGYCAWFHEFKEGNTKDFLGTF